MQLSKLVKNRDKYTEFFYYLEIYILPVVLLVTVWLHGKTSGFESANQYYENRRLRTLDADGISMYATVLPFIFWVIPLIAFSLILQYRKLSSWLKLLQIACFATISYMFFAICNLIFSDVVKNRNFFWDTTNDSSSSSNLISYLSYFDVLWTIYYWSIVLCFIMLVISIIEIFYLIMELIYPKSDFQLKKIE